MPDWLLLLLGALLAIPAASIGVVITYLLASPRIRRSKHITYSLQPDGSKRYRIWYKNLGPLRAFEVRARVGIVVPNGRRTTAVPVPIGMAEVFVVNAGEDKLVHLRLNQVAWDVSLPRGTSKPVEPLDLERTLRDLNAKVVFELIASSQVFQVRNGWKRSYSASAIIESPSDVAARARSAASSAEPSRGPAEATPTSDRPLGDGGSS